MPTEPHEVVADDLNRERLKRRLKWNAVAAALGITPQHLLRIRQGQSPISDDVAAAIDEFLHRPLGRTQELLTHPPAGVPHEWTADERAKMRSMSLDEAIAFGQKLKANGDERTAVVWIEEWAKERGRTLSTEDSRQ